MIAKILYIYVPLKMSKSKRNISLQNVQINEIETVGGSHF